MLGSLQGAGEAGVGDGVPAGDEGEAPEGHSSRARPWAHAARRMTAGGALAMHACCSSNGFAGGGEL